MPIAALTQLITTDVILYDVTRLINRRLAPFATGIDRVDISFALGLAESAPERVVFVAKRGGDGAIVERDLAVDFMRAMQEAWLDGEARDRSFSRRLERAGVVDNMLGPLAFDLDRLAAMPVAERSAHFAGLLAAGDPRHVLPAAFGRLHTVHPGLSRAATLALALAPRLANGAVRLLRKAETRLAAARDKGLAARLKERLDGRTATYFVCSHHGFAQRPGFLKGLRDAARFDVLAYIHDIIPIQYPEYIRPKQIGRFARYLEEIVAAGGRFVCNSADTAARLTAHGEAMGWQAPVVAVIRPKTEVPPLADRPPSPAVREILAGALPYFVTVGTIEPRKNHLLLLHLWRELADAGLAVVPHLHIVGKRGWENENVVDLLERSPAIGRHVTEHGALDDGSLFHLLKGASALLFPSFAEGLGLPLIEAAALGVPVIASDLPVFRELGLDGVTLIDPLDAAAWKRECLAATARKAAPDEGPSGL